MIFAPLQKLVQITRNIVNCFGLPRRRCVASCCRKYKSKSGKKKKGSMKPGPFTRNKYLNFLREYRINHCGLSPVETVKNGAKEWNALSPEEKQQYEQPCPFRNRKPRKKKAARKPRKKKKKKKRFVPIKRTGFALFLRSYRKYNCKLSPLKAAERAALIWSQMTKREKQKFEQAARKVAKKRQSRRRSVPLAK